MPMSESVRNMLSDAATVLLLAVAVTTALFEGSHFAGVARIAGVLFVRFSRLAPYAVDFSDCWRGRDDGIARVYFWCALSQKE